MNPEILQSVLACQRLPTLPAVALRVLELTRDRNASLQDLATTITSDAALTTKVLKTVNSSFYGLRKPCSSINQAIVMMGLAAVKSLALGFSLVSSLSQVRAGGFDLQAHWRRSLISGISAKCVAAEDGGGADEECFLGGLLQDIGVMALLVSLGDEYTRVLDAARGHHDLHTHERRALGATHADVGALLASRWRLPDVLVIPIKYHERPSAAPPEYRRIVHAVAVGNAVADAVDAANPGPAVRRLHELAGSTLGLTPDRCDAILATAIPATRQIARLFEVDAGRLPSPEELLRRAREQLADMSIGLTPATPTAVATPLDPLDPLTGLPGRGDLCRVLVTGFEQAAAGVRPLSLAVCAIDQAATLALRDPALLEAAVHAVAQRLGPHFAAASGVMLARYDAPRLGVVLCGMLRPTATRLMDAAREIIARDRFDLPAPDGDTLPIHLTLSIGLACVDTSTRDRIHDAQALVSFAEAALAAAQRQGEGALRVFIPRAQAA